MQPDGYVEIGPEDAPDDVNAAVIWLHGLGADGHDFEPLVPEMRLADDIRVRWIFPHAPVRPVTLNGGYPMRAWYDIVAIARDARRDITGIREAEAILHGLVHAQHAAGIPYRRIVVAGFSQGGAIALSGGLQFEQPLAGIVGLSTYIPDEQIPLADANRNTPIFMAHGEQDPIVPMMLGEASRDWLLGQGCRVDWSQWPMPHSVCLEEIHALREWLQARLGQPV